MGRVVAFSEFDSYLKTIQWGPSVQGTILDTNILISSSYEVKSDHEEVIDFLEKLTEAEFRIFTTVNTKSEYLDFHRRLIMTENLRDMLDPSSGWRISAAGRAQIQVQSGQLKRQEDQQGSDPVFSDRQLKKIKSAFSAGMHSGQTGWLSLCHSLLHGRLDVAENILTARGVQYISQHVEEQKGFFDRKIDWPDAKRIAEQTCLGLADAMIINAFQCSRFPFMVSADFDIGYVALASKEIRDVVMPDSVAKKYRGYHF